VVAGIQADLLEVEGGDGTYMYLPCMDVFIAKLDLEEMNIELRDDWIMQ
jgi:ribosomal 30S subunit maturation factor RimM